MVVLPFFQITNLEFAYYDFEQRGSVSASDFAMSMVTSANPTLLDNYLDRVANIADIPHFQDMRITQEVGARLQGIYPLTVETFPLDHEHSQYLLDIVKH